jgi:hypothetical protein
MMSRFPLAALFAAPLWLCAAPVASAARADTDACSVLTPARIGAAIGVPVGQGEHVTPTFVKTCTWNASPGSSVKFVTLLLQTAAAYDNGKRMASQMVPVGKGAAMKPVRVGEDGYYFVVGDQVGLLVRKGDVSFKVAVYATLPVDKKEAMELALAREALANH